MLLLFRGVCWGCLLAIEAGDGEKQTGTWSRSCLLWWNRQLQAQPRPPFSGQWISLGHSWQHGCWRTQQLRHMGYALHQTLHVWWFSDWLCRKRALVLLPWVWLLRKAFTSTVHFGQSAMQTLQGKKQSVRLKIKYTHVFQKVYLCPT